MSTTAPHRSTTLAVAAQVTLALEMVAASTVLAGAPNPGIAAAGIVPLLAAASLWRGHRVAPAVALLAAVTAVALRLVGLPLDLGRPGEAVPFVFSLLQVLTIGIAVTSALAVAASRRPTAPGAERLPARDPRQARVAAAGAGLAVALAGGLVLLVPQQDDAHLLTAQQLQSAPTVAMVNYRFEPAQLRSAADGTVALRFTNPSDDSHVFAIEDLDLQVEVPSGRSRVVVVQAPPGEYAFTCTAGSHADDGMKGRLTITAGAAPAAAATVPTSATHSAHDHG